MKKLTILLLTVVLTFSALFSFVGCNSTKYVANAIGGIEVEQFGFVVGKNASKKTEILNAMNKVIEETDIEAAVAYYIAVYKDETPTNSLQFANLSDNTGGTLNVYTCSGFEPYEFFNEDGDVIGVDIYLMELVCEELNMKINVVDMDFDAICGKIATEDNAVGAAGITILEDRKETLAFSNPYYSSVQCIISKESEGFTSLENLKGKKIGAQKGTTGAMMVEEAIASGVLKGSGAELVEYDTGAIAYAALKAGRIDIIVIDELPAQKLVR
ncbi:MAG: transporter substrate-binding domain-containing protein [Clostridia bacterium]|nr:transporter substrate-binding domain-containing protein [Clostridia bacterium]